MNINKLVETHSTLSHNLKAMLQDKIDLLELRLHKKRGQTAYKTLTHTEIKVLSTLRGEPATISEIARKLAVSRQAVHKIISNLVKRNLLKLVTIEGNARDKQILFTNEGEKMKREAAKLLNEIEQEVKESIGEHNFKLLITLLTKEW